MHWYNKFYKTILPSLCNLGFSATAWASASSAHGEAHSSPWLPMIFKILNLAALVYVLVVIARKHLPGFLNKRSDEIAAAINTATAKEAQAHALLQEYDKKLSELGQTMETMLKAARQEAEVQKQQILTAAAQEAKEILAAAQRSAQAQAQRLANQAKRLTIERAMQMAEQQISQQLDADNKLQSGIVDGFIREIPDAAVEGHDAKS